MSIWNILNNREIDCAYEVIFVQFKASRLAHLGKYENQIQSRIVTCHAMLISDIRSLLKRIYEEYFSLMTDAGTVDFV